MLEETNIFLFIIAGSVLVVAAMMSVVLYYIIGILRNVYNLTDEIKKGSENLFSFFKRKTGVDSKK